MQIEHFSFGLIRINGANHEHDVVIEGGKSANVRKSRLRNSATTLDTLRCQWRKTFPGSAAVW